MRYLHGTIGHGLLLRRNSPISLHAFSDVDWAGNQDDRTSTSAYVIFLGSNAISRCSRKQRSVARSSTEAEYRAVAHTASEVVWLSSLLSELLAPPNTSPTIYCDNIGATYLCSNPVFHSRMKHIAIDFHFVREKVQSGQLRVSHVSSADQLADSLTKPLSRTRFALLRSKIGVSEMPTILRGQINSKEVWNLEEEVTKVLEKGLAIGLNFNGRRKELLEIIARRKEVNDNRFQDLVRNLVQNHKDTVLLDN
ncbi:hypothetical protein LWI29_006006 [Acer saccharum]|uniref:Uncharacterized protein n=1 Tax=Acer saccharum TaxID=4024 RepID=A0AA39VWY2_ACESA|nr:hypothetical protein LWI29_006006 [Acer saccharum]